MTWAPPIRVDIDQFATDLEALIKSLDDVNPQIALQEAEGGVAAQIAVDDSEITEVLLKLVQLTERNGIKLPREFGLLVKQALYFDRYTKLLAPDLTWWRDDRVVGLTIKGRGRSTSMIISRRHGVDFLRVLFLCTPVPIRPRDH